MKAQETQLSRKITTELLHIAQMSPEDEICGLIGANNGIATTCYPVENTADQPAIRFQMDEKQQINAMSSMRDKNEDLFAIYHSHPTAPATPSATDIQHASYPEAIHLIISLNTKGVLEIRAFTIIEQTVKEMSISMTPN